jgi:hypothetical protein
LFCCVYTRYQKEVADIGVPEQRALELLDVVSEYQY